MGGGGGDFDCIKEARREVKENSLRVKKKEKRKEKARVGCLRKGLGVQTVHHIFWFHLKYIFILKLVYPHYSHDFAIFHE